MTEREYEELGEKILKIYSEAEQEMLRRTANRLARGVTQPGWTEVKQSEITEARRQIEETLSKAHGEAFSDDLLDALSKVYGDQQQKWLQENRIFLGAVGMPSITPNTEKVAMILRELDSNVNAAERSVLRRFDDVYSNVIGETSALVATGSYSQRQALQLALNRFADRGITGFTDRNGGKWDLSTYSEMALLTSIERSSRDGYLDTMKSYGYDLAIISSHTGTCPICAPWENVIISVSGEDHSYPSLDDAQNAGLFHPRCLHDFYTYHEGVHYEGLRDRPAPMEPPQKAYTVRSKQRYMERQVRKYKNRMAAAIDAQSEREAYTKVRQWQGAIRQLLDDYTDEPLPRKYWREGGRVTLRYSKSGSQKK